MKQQAWGTRDAPFIVINQTGTEGGGRGLPERETGHCGGTIGSIVLERLKHVISTDGSRRAVVTVLDMQTYSNESRTT